MNKRQQGCQKLLEPLNRKENNCPLPPPHPTSPPLPQPLPKLPKFHPYPLSSLSQNGKQTYQGEADGPQSSVDHVEPVNLWSSTARHQEGKPSRREADPQDPADPGTPEAEQGNQGSYLSRVPQPASRSWEKLIT